MGAFAEYAHRFSEVGLAVIPCGLASGKKPLVKWPSKKPGPETLDQWGDRWPDANIGVLTGLSGITVVDIDNPAHIKAAGARFGRTPVIAATPSGGQHWFFSSSGEGNRNLRSEGLEIDIKGRRGLVVAPPSTRPGDGAPYQWIAGSEFDLQDLPRISLGALADDYGFATRDRLYPEGSRNDGLFHEMLVEVQKHTTIDEFIAWAIERNSSIGLPRSEVDSSARSVWSYKERGTLPSKFDRAIDDLRKDKDAFYLLSFLRRWHGSRRGDFVIDQTRVPALVGMSTTTLRRAISSLAEHGFLRRTHTGTGRGNPHLYRLK